jgi:hypothetical protein
VSNAPPVKPADSLGMRLLAAKVSTTQHLSDDDKRARISRHYERKEAAAVAAAGEVARDSDELKQITALIHKSMAKARDARIQGINSEQDGTLRGFLTRGEPALHIESELNGRISQILGPDRMRQFVKTNIRLYRVAANSDMSPSDASVKEHALR